MKPNEAPEKIYLHPDIGDKEFIRPWLKRPFNENSIEYTRTDAFIEKACEWLGPVFKDLSGYYSGAEFLDDFRKYMKGE